MPSESADFGKVVQVETHSNRISRRLEATRFDTGEAVPAYPATLHLHKSKWALPLSYFILLSVLLNSYTNPHHIRSAILSSSSPMALA